MLKIIGSRIAAELERPTPDGVLRAAALAVSSARGASVFAELARSLAEILHVELAFIARPDDGAAGTMKCWRCSSTARRSTRLVRDRRHAVRGVLRDGFRVVPRPRRRAASPTTRRCACHAMSGLRRLSARRSRRQPIGLVSIASRAPLRHLDRIESMMQIFAVRAAAEIERAARRRGAAASEESYRTIFEAIEDGVVIHDWDTGALVDLNPKACEVSGFRRDEVLGAPLGRCSARATPPYTEGDARR